MVRQRPRTYVAVEGGYYSIGYSVEGLRSDPLDADYRHVRGLAGLSSQYTVFAVVHASDRPLVAVRSAVRR